MDATSALRSQEEDFITRLLALQDEDGQWAGGSYFPTRNDRRATHGSITDGQPWTATTWTLTTLRLLGCDAARLGDTADRLEKNALWDYENLPYWDGEVDVCINAMTLANGCWLGRDMTALAQWFVDHQMAEGGWDCEWVEGSTRASFHSTINAIDHLLWVQEQGWVGIAEHLHRPLITARQRAMTYLLERNLLYRRTTGELLAPWVLEFAYPYRWRYSALRALDALRRASALDGTVPDQRAAPAIRALRSLETPDGWVQQTWLTGQEWFALDVPVGQVSPYLTRDARWVLDWWEANRNHARGAGAGTQLGY